MLVLVDKRCLFLDNKILVPWSSSLNWSELVAVAVLLVLMMVMSRG